MCLSASTLQQSHGILAIAMVSHCGANAQWAFGWAPRFGLYAWDPHDPDQVHTGQIPRSVYTKAIKCKQDAYRPPHKDTQRLPNCLLGSATFIPWVHD